MTKFNEIAVRKHWTDNYRAIPVDALPGMIGKPIHLRWASSAGFVWILDKIEGGKMFLHTPKTGKRLVSAVGDGIYTQYQMWELDGKPDND